MQRNLDSYSLKTVANKVRNFKLAPSAKLSVKEQIQVLLSILKTTVCKRCTCTELYIPDYIPPIGF